MLALSLDVKHHVAVLDSDEPSLEPPPPLARQLELHAGVAAREALVVGQPLERTVEPRRRDLEALVVDALHRESAREMVAHPRTVFDRDAVARVDEDPEQPRARRLYVHELGAEPFERRPHPRFMARFRLHKPKMGATSHPFSKPVTCSTKRSPGHPA